MRYRDAKGSAESFADATRRLHRSKIPRPHRYAAPATLRVAMRAGEALRAGLKICERCRLAAFHLTKSPIATAFAMSIKKADTSGRIMKAVGAAPCTFETAVMLAMAVGVAPRAMPENPEAITAAR